MLSNTSNAAQVLYSDTEVNIRETPQAVNNYSGTNLLSDPEGFESLSWISAVMINTVFIYVSYSADSIVFRHIQRLFFLSFKELAYSACNIVLTLSLWLTELFEQPLYQ